MVRYLDKYLYVVLLILFGNQLWGQEIAFEHLRAKDGLSHISSTCLHQDQLGRIWIGTRDGLNFYDGVQITTYRPVRGDSTSILGHIVKQIHQKGDEIWALTESGISSFNMKTSKFVRYPLKGVVTMLIDGEDIILGTKRGVFLLDIEKKVPVVAKELFSENYHILSLLRDRSGNLWIGTKNNGLYKYQRSKDIYLKEISGSINTIFEDSQNDIWVGTQDHGIFRIDPSNNDISHFLHDPMENSLINNIVRDINEDSKGRIWIGTFFGLSIYDKATGNFENHLQSDQNPYGLSHNSIFSILRDKQGTMWLGTYYGGVNFFNPEYHIYTHYRPKENEESISYRVIGQIVEDYLKNLWIATEGGGLDYFDRSKGSFKHYAHVDGENSLSHNNVKAIQPEGKNTVYIGTHMGGLNRLDLKTGEFTVYQHDENDPQSIPSNVVNAIIPWKGKYLLGTHKGVVLFDPVKEIFQPFFIDDEQRTMVGTTIFCLTEDSRGNIWIGTEKGGGLTRYNPEKGTFRRYQFSEEDSRSIGSNTVYQVFEDHQFRIWVATLGGGLNLFDSKSDDFTCYTNNQHNLPSDIVYGIQESRFGNLWISTSKGLARFDVENNRFYTYDSENGFPLSDLSERALLLTSQGQIFVGGMNGMISFNEKDLLKKPKPFELIFSKLRVNNKEVTPRSQDGILETAFPFTTKITLGPEHTVFSIQYAACNFIRTNKNHYEYQLVGVDKEWVNAGHNTTVSYTNLSPGTYTFKVKGIDAHHHTVLAEKELIIEVEPPLYKTWYAFLFYVILIASITIWLNQFYLSKARLVDRLNAEHRENEQIKELNQSKLRFFTNISHEFRTPLTLIMGTLEAVLEEPKIPSRMYNKLLLTHNNARRLKGLITELLDFRKLEQGHLSIKVSENDFSHFLEEIFQSFSEYAEHNNVSYELSKPSYPITMWFDPQQMEKVFYNLLSNAFKFANKEEGIITVKIEAGPEYIEIQITDNGAGMPKDRVDKIFDRFYQIDNLKGKSMGQGSGIGLALSKGIVEIHGGTITAKSSEGAGSTFAVRLKKGNHHFKEDQIVESVTSAEEKNIDFVPEIHDHTIASNVDEEFLDEGNENAPKLLIVEDNDDMREMIKGLFSASFEIFEAEDGEKGLAIAMDRQPDLIISDVMMPVMSGTEMCAKIKRNILTSHIPVILLTARTAMEYKIEGLETGADDYITKPFSVPLLRTRVKNLLNNRKSLQEKYSKNPEEKIQELATTSIDQKLLDKALEIVNNHLDDSDFDVNVFATEMGLGRTRLYAKIKGVTGHTPNDFIMQIRLKKGAEMLVSNPEMNISEIAYAVGFGTPRYFSRCFREHFGVSPSKYGKAPDSDTMQNSKDQVENGSEEGI